MAVQAVENVEKYAISLISDILEISRLWKNCGKTLFFH
jgi:hypothetical protein